MTFSFTPVDERRAVSPHRKPIEHGWRGYNRGCHCATCVEGARARRQERRAEIAALPDAEPLPTKEQAACCTARRDALGRLPIGFCSVDCVRRPSGGSR